MENEVVSMLCNIFWMLAAINISIQEVIMNKTVEYLIPVLGVMIICILAAWGFCLWAFSVGITIHN